MSSEDFGRALPGERGSTGEDFVSQRSHGVDIGPLVDVRIGCRLLGRHIGWRPDGDPGGRDRLVSRGVAHGFGHTEVSHEGVAPREEHVLRLDIPMHDVQGVCVPQGVRHLDQDLHGVVNR